MGKRRPLYLCVAGVEPNNPPQSEPGFERFVEGSAIEFWERQGTTYKHNPHKGPRFPGF